MANITYLFGAGASALTLPTVGQLPSRLTNFKQSINNPDFYSTSTRNEIDSLTEQVEWLIDACEKHASIDTFAKKLFIKKQKEELDQLKNILSVFFPFEQSVRGIDKRYDSFFASIITESISSLPPTIKIITWNYDSQFELAFMAFSDIPHLSENQRILKVVTKNVRRLAEPDEHHFCLFKLNGSASFRGLDDEEILPIRDKPIVDPAWAAIDWYSRQQKFGALYSNVSFAWEQDDRSNEVMNLAVSAIKSSEVLVIVGYSIPFFNRKIDKWIIERLTGLKRIYIQDPDAANVRDRLLSFNDGMKSVEVVPIENTGQFFLPPELSL
jgi:hypothetical protein